MAATLLKIHPENPSFQKIRRVVDVLRAGGVMIYPTDTVYGIGCDLHNRRAIDRLSQMIGVKPGKMKLSFICQDLSNLSFYTRNISTEVFKVMKKAIPGPYTFILQASTRVPKIFGGNKKSVGIRVPDNHIPREIVKELGNPIISASLKVSDEIVEYATDPGLIIDDYKNVVDVVVDGGFGGNIPSTVIDMCTDEWVVIREGLGDASLFYQL